ELWHFDKGKPPERRDQVLMLDARNIYRKVTRTINDFSPEQLQNIAAIVWLYRGQSDRFTALVQAYLERTIAEAMRISANATAFRRAYDGLSNTVSRFIESLPEDAAEHQLLKERDSAAAGVFES